MRVYKRLTKGEYHSTVAKEVKISETHVARIASFLVKEYFLNPISPDDVVRLYSKTKRIPTLKILCELLTEKKRNDGGSSLVEFQKLQYKCEYKGEVNDRVIKWCRCITPKGTNKYLFPTNNNLKLGFTAVFNDGKSKKSVMIYPNRIHLTAEELSISDDIINDRIRRIANYIQHLFKIKLGMPIPIGRYKEYAFVPKEKFLIDALDEVVFEVESSVGKVMADKSGDKRFLDGKQIEFDKKDLAMTYLKLIPSVHMVEQVVLDHRGKIEQLEEDVKDIKTMLAETKPFLQKIVRFIDDNKALLDKREKENLEHLYG